MRATAVMMAAASRSARALALAASLVAPSCVRAPAPLDVHSLVARRGAIEARRDLAARVLAHPRDVQARLALAELADQTGRPSEAIEQLEAVERLGGPLGTRWHASDRARLARLLLARGRLRLQRTSPTALADLERARHLGAAATDDELLSARIAAATTQLRHVDARVRASARAVLGDLAKPAPHAGDLTDEAAWLGARRHASPAERAAFGTWAWSVGARREAYEQLAAWHAATPSPRDEALQSAYLRALAWWSPLWLGDVPPPPAEDLVGPERCWFPGTQCAPPVVEAPPLPPLADAGPLASDPRVAAAVRYATTRIPGAMPPTTLAAIAAAYVREHVAAAGLAGASPARPGARNGVDATSATIAGADAGRWDPSRPHAPADADGAHARTAVVADRLTRDAAAASVDAAAASGAIGALFDALGDATRARAWWQDAATASPEPAFLRGRAEAIARAGDGPAALVYGNEAAAAWGDPAIVWTGIAAGLLQAGRAIEAMEASRYALELAGPDELPRALDLAIEASRTLGRAAQADAMVLQRAQLAPRGPAADADAIAALAEHHARPTASTTARLWVVSRAHPRDLELRVALHAALGDDDPRRATIDRELVELAGDESSARAYAAAAALR